ncbi:Thioredoxin-like protein 1 [Exophiala dermatitidis]|uniref:Thioredoxin 1 n=2 Tax=Exophiala dermatitidis TaxID=5970 RepID=H6BM48_EXODN|nr:thioredoxin 1 [Exophiala dermatitidis NIH/UT8656]KAJ4514655.1 Thioredoxin-like protein 1 [Exophiala dermatitidis]EHY51984.1 thioredoxin 1 [Exophiala dermatitidis NIH/UT8656]KAJ4518090.1 Thioredoxin-like protein 1 [Exophiala dermatitidis]KAJ4520989.1 Thioredoxin-like protein 1 [Exophiala dermatitidis]KAJ4545995.1 Thioredoxin-like protein 1 [Exophiala dermatitidis]
MSKTIQIESTSQFSALLSSSAIVVADFYADWCGPCRQIAPIYEQLSAQLSRPNKITFAKINTDQQVDLARSYGVKAMPTFMIFKNARRVEFIEGADPRRLSNAVKQLATEANKMEADESAGEGGSGSGNWLGAELPRGYDDVTAQVDVLGMELLNWDSEFGNARTLIRGEKPRGQPEAKKDWVQSDTDEQLMLYIPFQCTLKIHSIQLTFLVPENTDDDESPSRPKLIKLYTNRPRVLGFDEAEDTQATQEITLSEKDWDPKTGTAKMDLRLVKFQNVSSLVVFVVESEGDNEKVRLDRIRIIGETGEKRDGKIEKIASDE